MTEQTSETEEEAKEMVEIMSVKKLFENIQHFNVGKHYIEKARE